MTTQADGGTAPAASLLPFYENKEVIKTFIVVTDEEENSSDNKGHRFATDVFTSHIFLHVWCHHVKDISLNLHCHACV